MAHPPHCPDCKKTMDPGYLLEHTQRGMNQVEWVGGLPEKSIWTGLKTKDRPKLKVVVYRCPRCGLLRGYALTP